MPWRELLTGGELDAPFLVVFILFGSALAVAPFIRVYQLSFVERVLDTRLSIVLLSAHVGVMLGLWRMKLYVLLFAYLALVVTIGLLSPLLQGVGELLTVRKLVDEDIKRNQAILRANPYDALTRVALANNYADRGKWDDALAEYDLAVSVDPHYAERASIKLRYYIDARVRAKGKKKYSTDLHGELQVPEDKISFKIEKDDMDIDLRS